MFKLFAVLTSLISLSSFAVVERITIQFGDEIHSGNSEIYLIDKVLEVRPDFSAAGKKLNKVVLFAKSSDGTASGQVKTGTNLGPLVTIPGTLENYSRSGHYYSINFNDLIDDGAEGDWTLNLNGDVTLQKATLFVDQVTIPSEPTPYPTPEPMPTPYPTPEPMPTPYPTPEPIPTPYPTPEPTPWPTPGTPDTNITVECKYKLVTFWGKKVKTFKATHTGPSSSDVLGQACARAKSLCDLAANASGGAVLKCELSD